jgi:dihydroorotate dehydrogenase (NAD+) catalytic subunit
MVWEVARAVTVPVVGLGGITRVEDALQFIMAGASAVQVGSAGFGKPGTIIRVADDLVNWMADHRVANLDEIRGCAVPNSEARE